MTQRLEEIMPDKGRFDKIIHAFIVDGSIDSEWTERFIERSNHILASYKWFGAGEYIPLDGDFALEYSYFLYEPVALRECRFERISYDDLPSVVMTAHVPDVGPVLLMNYDELCTSNGVPFDQLFKSHADEWVLSELPRYWRRQPNSNGHKNS